MVIRQFRMRQLIDYVDTRAQAAGKAWLGFTFDDGSYNTTNMFFPFPEEYAAEHAIFCIVGKYTDDCTEQTLANPVYGYMRWIDVLICDTNSQAEIANPFQVIFISIRRAETEVRKPMESAWNIKKLQRGYSVKLQNGCLSRLKFAPHYLRLSFGAYSKGALTC